MNPVKYRQMILEFASAVITEAEALTSGAAPPAGAPGSSGSGAGAGESALGVGNVARLDFGRGKNRNVSEDLEEPAPFV